MLVNHNSIIGVNSITANGDQLYFYKEDGTDAIFNISNINVLNTSGVSTFAGLESTGDLVISGNVSIGGTLTYEDVTNVDSVGVITARSGIEVTSGTVLVGGDPNDGANAGTKMTTSGVIQSTRASGSGASAVFMGFLEGDTSANFRVNANGSGYLMGDVGIGTDSPVKLLHLRSDSTSAGHTLLRLENLQNNTGGPTECHIDMWLDNSNSNNTGASIGIVEDSNDGYADLVFKTTPATNSDTLQERVRFDREGGVLIAGQPMHVCYAVTVASRSVTGGNSTTLLPSSSYDPMNDFNETTGVYTVPIAGRYLLFYGTQGKTSSNSNAGSIYYNLNNIGLSGQCLYYGDAYSGNSKTTILNLSQNDTIKFQIYGNNAQSYTINGAHFGIYLLG